MNVGQARKRQELANMALAVKMARAAGEDAANRERGKLGWEAQVREKIV